MRQSKSIFLAAFFLLTLLSVGSVQAQFTLPALPYDYKALEPYVDAQTMEIHHGKHHQAYITNLNKALAETGQSYPLEKILAKVSGFSETVRNNAGGHYNHSLFWTILTPTKNTKPSAALKEAIQDEFQSMDSLKNSLNRAAMSRFGSGWAWLIVTPDKKLAVCSTPNQDNPLMDVAPVQGIPILGIDVWEHAYYLKYQNKRADYLSALWNVLNWTEISRRYEEAMAK